MKKTNKILSVIMALMMVISIIPMSAFTASAEENATSGTCGENVSWTFDETTGTLTISGTGEMDLYPAAGNWDYLDESIKTVVIGDDVTSIGIYAFNKCTNLTDVTIGNSVTTICNYAFQECTSLECVTIPDSVTFISTGAFGYCKNLKKFVVSENNQNFSNDEAGVLYNKDKTGLIQYPIGNTRESYIIPEGVIIIDEGAFIYAENLTSVTIPDGVVSIYDGGFGGCTNLTNIILPNTLAFVGRNSFKLCTNLTDVYYYGTEEQWDNIEIENTDNEPLLNATKHFVAENNFGFCGENLIWTFDEATGTLTISGTGEMYDYEKHLVNGVNTPWTNFNIDNIVIENGVTSIGKYAFYYSNIETISIPNSVTSIGIGAFQNCRYLSSVTIGENVTTIGNSAFRYCSNLKNITIPQNVSSIGVLVFADSGIDSIIVDENNQFFSNDEYGVLFNKDKTVLVSYPEDNESTTYTVPDSVTVLSRFSFCNCDNLTSVIIGNGVTSIEDNSFENCDNIVNVTIPGNVITIGSYAFEDCIALENIILSEGLTNMDEGVFSNCDSLESITIPDSVTSMGNYMFTGCGKLTSVGLGKGISTIPDGTFSGCSGLKEVAIPENITMIKLNAFYGCNILTDVYYCCGTEEQWKAVYIGGFNDAIINATIHYHKINSEIVTVATCIKNGLSNNTCEYCNYSYEEVINALGHNYSSLVTEPTCTEDGYTTYTCETCGDSYIADKTEAIGHLYVDDICVNCTGISQNKCGDNLYWTFDEATSTLTVLGTGEMYNYDTKSVAPWKIYNNSIKNVIINDGATSVGNYAFAHCYSVISITIPDSVTAIGNYACVSTNLEEIIIPDSVTTIGDYAFADCDRIISITIPDSVTAIGNHTFRDCASLENIVFPDDLVTIGNYAFGGCTSLEEIIIPAGVTTIGNYAFSGCTSLTTVVIPDSVTSLGEEAFSECTSLTNITIPNSVTTIGDFAFGHCSSLTSVTIPDSVTTIGIAPFALCYNLSNIIVDENNPNYSSDESGVLYNKDKTILYQYPIGNTRESYTLAKDTLGIYYAAFAGCENLTSIVIPDGFIAVVEQAFAYCSNLTDVYYCGTEEQWKSILILSSNEPLLNATIHYNYAPPFTGIKDDYFYKDDVKQKAYQLVEFEGDYYFINDYHKIAKNKRIYLSERFVEGFTYEDGTPLAVGYYEFDENGKMIIKNGVVGDYFYKNGVIQKAYQLVEYEGDFYFINDSHKVAKNKRIYLSQRFVDGFTYADGTPLKVGYYEFDENGKMVILNGPVGDYFYKNNVRLNAYQLVEYEGDYYFINDSHKLAKSKRIYLSQIFVEGTDLKVGYYEFDADGKIIIE